MTRHGTLAVVLSVILTTGCLAASPDDAPGSDRPADTGAATVLADVTSDDCRYNDVIFPMPAAQAQTYLPDGFSARVMIEPAAGFLVVNLIDCETGPFAWTAADLFVIVEPPAVHELVEDFDAANRPDAAAVDLQLDVYMLAFHTDHEGLQDLLDQAGVPHAPGRVAKAPVPTPAGSLAHGELEDDAGPLLTYAVKGVDAGAFRVLHRQWHASEAGLALVERDFTANGGPVPVTQGPAQCVLRPGSPFITLLGDTPCALGQDVVAEWGWTGRAYLFPASTLAGGAT